MRNKERPDPVIPDHEVLRRIGGGAYGEVWLARGVTGALRAVKVVWREDFEDERGFEREFEGILKFEPISRDHPGLVNVLHVGRAPDASSFYYYVMELGDDVRSGREINPIEYEPRTLRTDLQAAGRRPLATGFCIEAGLRLAEGLHHLHENGLAHRDVKPSNVIFVGGRAKLADIGLVAARGQRTFVGTEGFVPPEGPGSAQADVYSLGKVLYECATGRDRLEFPELPDELPPPGKERKLWLALNQVICDVCEPHVSRRKIRTAGEMADSLRALQGGKRHRRRGRAGAWLTACLLALFLLGGAWEVMRRGPHAAWLDPWAKAAPPPPSLPERAMVRIVSHPEGADVIDPAGRVIGATPLTVEAAVGERVRFTVRKEGYRSIGIDQTVPATASGEPLVLGDVLKVFAPPEAGQPWLDPLGNRYQPVGDNHVASALLNTASWRLFEEDARWKGRKHEMDMTDNGVPVRVVMVEPGAAAAFCEWLGRVALRDGYLTEESEVWAECDEGFERPELPAEVRLAGLRPFRPVVGPLPYGTIEVTTRPEGAEVYANGQAAGTTYGPLSIGRLRPGPVELVVQLGGYREKRVRVDLGKAERKRVEVVLEQNQSVVYGAPWQNSLGMRFVPVGKDLMVSVWETRVVDYEAFRRENEHPPPLPPDFRQAPEHPVVMVARDDAETFCRWLTARERADQRISRFDEYRLPSDLEWSRLVGLEDDETATPAERDARRQRVFPWGVAWPPGEETGMVGNLADESALRLPGVPPERTIPGYVDGFDTTAPVGSFPANQFGLHDLCGNVHEWVSDAYSPRQSLGVLRGGGWNTHQAENLYSGARNTAPPSFRDSYYGFRVVVAKVPAETEGGGEDSQDKPKEETTKDKGNNEDG